MVQKNSYIKNINIKNIKIYFKFYRQLYDKKKNINYTVAILLLLLNLNKYYNSVFTYYTKTYMQTYCLNKVVYNNLQYIYSKNKFKFTDQKVYSMLLNNSYVIRKDSYLYNYTDKSKSAKLKYKNFRDISNNIYKVNYKIRFNLQINSMLYLKLINMAYINLILLHKTTNYIFF